MNMKETRAVSAAESAESAGSAAAFQLNDSNWPDSGRERPEVGGGQYSGRARASFALSRDVKLIQVVLALGAPAVYLKGLYPPMAQANPVTHLRPQGK